VCEVQRSLVMEHVGGTGGGEREIKRERGEHGYEKRKEHKCVQGVFVRLKAKAYVYAGGVFVR
jgi:hypothetical protein